MATVPFTDNCTDLSSNRGFQFKFMCMKCGNGYMSCVRPNAFGTAAAAARRSRLSPLSRCWPARSTTRR